MTKKRCFKAHKQFPYNRCVSLRYLLAQTWKFKTFRMIHVITLKQVDLETICFVQDLKCYWAWVL